MRGTRMKLRCPRQHMHRRILPTRYRPIGTVVRRCADVFMTSLPLYPIALTSLRGGIACGRPLLAAAHMESVLGAARRLGARELCCGE